MKRNNLLLFLRCYECTADSFRWRHREGANQSLFSQKSMHFLCKDLCQRLKERTIGSQSHKSSDSPPFSLTFGFKRKAKIKLYSRKCEELLFNDAPLVVFCEIPRLISQTLLRLARDLHHIKAP